MQYNANKAIPLLKVTFILNILIFQFPYIKNYNSANAQEKRQITIKLDSMYQLCTIRQREILGHNKVRIESGMLYLNTKDPAQKESLMRSIEIARNSAAEAELSWQRLNCSDVLSRQPGQISR